MRKHLYLRLAASNIRRNGRFYAPFLIAAALTTAVFFNLASLGLSQTLPGGGSMATLMGLGIAVVGIFSVIFLYYTNSFLIRRRKKELALYNILGMEKRHIGRVLAWETLLSALLSIGGGLVTGIVLDRLLFLILLRLLHFDVTVRYELQPSVIALTAAVFGAIFLLLLLTNIRQIRRANPAELLAGGNVGEREPRARWLLVIAGVLCLGGGYYLSLTTKNALAALGLFFVAVVLVIIGTFCLFTAGSIAVLQALKAKKSYYYKARHFVSISGMLYRMKQNAAGLANICILSTMVLVTIATTVSLYVGMNSILAARYPRDISLSCDTGGSTALSSAVDAAAEAEGAVLTDRREYTALTVSFGQKDGGFVANPHVLGGDAAYLELMTPENYAVLSGEAAPVLTGNEVALYTVSGSLGDVFSLLGETYTVRQRLTAEPRTGEMSLFAANLYYLVVSGDSVLEGIRDRALAAGTADRTGAGASDVELRYNLQFNVAGTDEEELALFNRITDAASRREGSLSFSCRAEGAGDFYEVYGGFLFVGSFLGFLFLMAAVLIIYYKQIIEGYDDRARFEIMQKVGMEEKLVRASVRSQILTMFALPLGAALVHLAFAFPMLSRLLYVLSLYDVGLFALCTLGTAGVFVAFYVVTYAVTARAYYRIVSGAREE